jgi:hypothetical protein
MTATATPWTFEVGESSTVIHSPEGFIAEFYCDDHAANAELVCKLRNTLPVVAFLEVTGCSGDGVSNVCLTHNGSSDQEVDGLHKTNVAILPLSLWGAK